MAQFNGTVEQLEQSVALTEATADYIVESGTVAYAETDTVKGGTWYYQVYKSGYKRLFTNLLMSGNVTPDTAFGGLYLKTVDIIPPYPTNISFDTQPLASLRMYWAELDSQYDTIVQARYSATKEDTVTPPKVNFIGTNNTIGYPKLSVVIEGY